MTYFVKRYDYSILSCMQAEELTKEWQQSSNTDCFTKSSLQDPKDCSTDNPERLASEQKIKPEKSTPVDTRDSVGPPNKLDLVATSRKRKKSKTTAKDPDSSKSMKSSSSSKHVEKEDQASSKVQNDDSPLSGKVDKPNKLKGESEAEND